MDLDCGSSIEDSHKSKIAGMDVQEDANDIEKGIATQFTWPSLHLVSGNRKASYFSLCVLLQNAAVKGDTEETIRLLGMNHKSLLCAAITEGYETILHVGTGAGQIRFVQEIVKLMEPEDLMLQDINGNTAFCFAAMIGNLQIAEIILEKNESLSTVRGGKNMTPLYLAALFGHSNMAKFLYPKTKKILTGEDRKATFLISMHMGVYDLALILLEDDKEVAVARHAQYGTALHMLARNPSAFVSSSPGLLRRLINSFPGTKSAQDTDLTSSVPLELVRRLWREILQRDDIDAVTLIRNPSNLLFDAAESGNFEFLAELLHSYPDLVHELDENGRSIFHIAALHGHSDKFNLIHEIGFAKELLVTYLDNDQNNILHLAAKYQHRSLVSTVSDTALDMQRELLNFKEVEMIVKPSYKQMKNSEGKTPRELFIMEHTEQLKSAELWMKKTASSCMLIASLVASVMFAVAFSVPGGNNNKIGISIYTGETLYQVFAAANAVSLFCSSISILIFLSILTSRWAEDDFLKFLPLKLMTGLTTLFTSIITMLIAFSSVFFMTYHYTMNWIPILIIVVASATATKVVLPRYPVVKP